MFPILINIFLLFERDIISNLRHTYISKGTHNEDVDHVLNDYNHMTISTFDYYFVMANLLHNYAFRTTLSYV